MSLVGRLKIELCRIFEDGIEMVRVERELEDVGATYIYT